MEKTSAPGTAVWLHLRPTAGNLKLGWEVIQTSLRAHCALALAAEQRARGHHPTWLQWEQIQAAGLPQTPGCCHGAWPGHMTGC